MECEFKFIQQWRSKLLFHIEQQLNISKTLRSTFPNHGQVGNHLCTSQHILDTKL